MRGYVVLLACRLLYRKNIIQNCWPDVNNIWTDKPVVFRWPSIKRCFRIKISI